MERAMAIEQALDIVSEMIKTPKFDAQEVARQKILQIATLKSRSREAAARRQLLGVLFPDYSYGLDPCGSEASIAGITRDAAQAWHKLYVADKKPMVVIIGDTQGTSLAAYFVAHFSGSRFEDVKLPDKFPASLQKPGELDVSSDGNASLVMVGFQALPNLDEDSFPLIVFRNHASGLAGRLTGAIQDRVPSARQLSVRYEPKLRAGAVIVRMSVSPQEEELAQKTIAEELQRILTSLLPYRDYRSALNTAVAEVQIRQQNRFCQIGDMIQSILAGKGLEGFEEFASRLQEVKQADLQDVAQRVFKIEKSVTLRVHGKS
jgi:predicted Zn-dependent peptidase